MERFRALISKVATGSTLTREEASHAALEKSQPAGHPLRVVGGQGRGRRGGEACGEEE